MKQQIIYYSDELNDEFSIPKIKERVIDQNYKYKHNILWDLCSYFLQNFLSMPIKVSYLKIRFRAKCIGKEKFKECKKEGYFIYSNHTQPFADTFIPSVANYPKRNFLIVNPVNISLKGTGTLVEMLGAIPIPSSKEAMKNFLNIIEHRVNKGNSITIYPEAHIWPYYTKIRNFKDVSFKYPVKLEKPVFCVTNTYQARGKNKDKVKIVTYIDGPFYTDKGSTLKERQKALRDKVYHTMVDRSKNSNIEYIKYVKKEEAKEVVHS